MINADNVFCLEVKGDFACFTRPEFKVERVSYDVITPSAARAIFEAIFWKPAIKWEIVRIEVLNPIQWTSVRRNEVNPEFKSDSAEAGAVFIDDGKSRQQRNTLMLRKVHYRLYAKLIFLPKWKRKKTKNPDIDKEEINMLRQDETPAKYMAMFERRASKGQCFTQPYLGCREFPAEFKLVKPAKDDNLKEPIKDSCNFGWMFYDLDYDFDVDYDKRGERAHPSLFYPAIMENGVIIVDKSKAKR